MSGSEPGDQGYDDKTSFLFPTPPSQRRPKPGNFSNSIIPLQYPYFYKLFMKCLMRARSAEDGAEGERDEKDEKDEKEDKEEKDGATESEKMQLIMEKEQQRLSNQFGEGLTRRGSDRAIMRTRYIKPKKTNKKKYKKKKERD